MGRIVWLASYPKSGNTWLRAVYTALRTGSGPDINALGSTEIASSRWLFDVTLGVRSSDLTPEETDLLRPRVDEATAAASAGDIWRKIHDCLLSGPSGEPIVSVGATRSALYLVRDPRDVAVSLARQAGRPLAWAVKRLGDPAASVSRSTRFLESQLRQRLGSWSHHVTSWTGHLLFPVHVVRYEDCVADPLGTFKAAFAAGGLVASDAAVADAVARSSWERLRAQEDRSGFREEELGHSPFFRRGAAGAWVDELPAVLARQVEDQHGEVMARFGYLPP
jgi:aryl sulfotransferase